MNTISTYPRYSSQVSHHSRQHRSPDSSGDSGDRSRRSYVSQDRSRPNRHSTRMPLPKLSFEGEHWIGFITQFELVAKNFGWSEAEKLANFAMSLKKGAAEFYSILSTRKEQDYEWLKNKFQHHYGGTDSATTIRYELLQMEQKEDESLEEYLARLQKMVVASFPDESKREACSPFFVDAFMKGCRNKGAVLSAAEKHPNSNSNSTFIALNLCQKTDSKAHHTKTLFNIQKPETLQGSAPRRKQKGNWKFRVGMLFQRGMTSTLT